MKIAVRMLIVQLSIMGHQPHYSIIPSLGLDIACNTWINKQSWSRRLICSLIVTTSLSKLVTYTTVKITENLL